MKELSIKEKAKRYDEALKVLHKYDGANIMFSQSLKEEMFPELKESEDEKIRKEILSFCQDRAAKYFNDPKYVNIDKWIAWLEKKGEIEYALKSSKDEDVHKFVQYIEKQAKAYELNLPNRSYDIYAFAKDILAWLEKQGEQKSADKVEPKFNVGDWVVFNNKHQSIYQVEKIEDGYYILRHTHGGTFRVCVLHDESLRLWTIQDAKDGDVLYDNDSNTVLIFKSQTCGWVKVYCDFWTNKNKFTGTDSADYGRVSEMDLKPATKEQRDLLFKKMHEAGYEWNAEKKELKKIEQNFTWSEEDKKAINDIMWIIEAYRKNGFNETHIQKADSSENWLKSLKPQSTWKPSEYELKVLKLAAEKDGACLMGLYEDLKKLREE